MTGSGVTPDKLDRIKRHWQRAAAAAADLVLFDQFSLVLDHWSSLWDQGGLPRRGALDPTRIGPALPYVYIMDYDGAARSLRYRLIGEHVRSTYARPVKDRLLSEVVSPSAYAAVASYFMACPELPAITLLTGRLYQDRNMPAFGQRLLMPLLDEQGRGDGLLGLTLLKYFYETLDAAIEDSDRRVSILPLDGSEPVTTVS